MMSSTTTTSDSDPVSRSSSTDPHRDHPLTLSLRSDPQPSNGVGPCPIALKSILRRKLCYNRASASSDSVNSTCSHRSVTFDERVDEHLADEWDRSSCPVACPTSRDIWELKKMQRELLPNGTGVIQDDRHTCVQQAEDEYFFDIFGDDDVDSSQRRRGPPPPRRAPVKKLLNKVPIGLCPILPDAAPLLMSTPVTPNNSMSPSPLDSPPHGSPVLAPVKTLDMENTKNKRGGPLMNIMPLLPPTPPETTIAAGKGGNSAHSIPTPPETPTFAKRELPTVHDVRPPSSGFLPCGPAPIVIQQPRQVKPKEDVPQIKLSSSPSRSPPTIGRLTLLPVLPQRATSPLHSSASSPPKSSMTSSPTWPISPAPSKPLPAMMKIGGRPLSASASPTTATPVSGAGFVPFTMSFKATTGRS